MHFNLLDRIGDWNPQLFREIKGRLAVRNVVIPVAISLVGQLLLYLFWAGQTPSLEHTYLSDHYCRLRHLYESYQQQSRQLGEQYRQLQAQFKLFSGREHYDPEKIQQIKVSLSELTIQTKKINEEMNAFCPADAVDIPRWWNDHYPHIFTTFSVIIVFTLLVVGCYLLISDLAREERRGTLNFLRLSPQSPLTILGGKIIGVPILLYLAAIVTLPFHLWLGLSAKMPLVEIFSFYVLVVGSCAFFYSAALLFGLVCSWLGGFQAWLGGGVVFMFLWIVTFKPLTYSPLDWMNLFNPSLVLSYLVNRTGSDYTGYPLVQGAIQNWQWFYLPVGATGISFFLFALLNYSLWTGWIWQSLNRRFHNPNTTIISKQQSYWLVFCVETIILGFAMRDASEDYPYSGEFTNLFVLASANVVLFLSLIASLSPQRQALIDWARYRREKVSLRKGFWNSSLVQDLIAGEKSPAVLAIALNLAIAITPFIIWLLLWPTDSLEKTKAFFALAFFVSLTMIYTTIVQLMLLLKTNKRSLWAAGTVVALSFLPPMMLGMFGLGGDPEKYATLWLFSTFPWAGIQHAATITMFQAFVGEFLVLTLLNLQLTRQLRRAGESASKALFAGRPSLPN